MREATITPVPDSGVCEVANCERTNLLARVHPDSGAEARTLCPRHRVEYLREVYNQ
jgi:hypothetical protein